MLMKGYFMSISTYG